MMFLCHFSAQELHRQRLFNNIWHRLDEVSAFTVGLESAARMYEKARGKLQVPLCLSVSTVMSTPESTGANLSDPCATQAPLLEVAGKPASQKPLTPCWHANETQARAPPSLPNAALW